MANSLIEDVLNEQPINDGGNSQKQQKNKKSKKVIIALIILLLIIIACAAGIIYYLSNQKEEISVKQAFFDSITKNNIEQVSSIDLYEEFVEKILSENSSIETDINISYVTDDLSVNNIVLSMDSKNDLENLKSYTEMNLSYSDNDIFDLEILSSDEAIALKSSEIVTSFVGVSYEYILDNILGISYLSELIGEEEYGYYDPDYPMNDDYDEDYSYDYYDDYEDYSYDEDIELGISENSIQIYKDILDKNLDESQFTKNEVTLNMDSGMLDCTEYTLTMTEEQFIDICKQLLEGFETDADTIEMFSSILTLAGYSETDLIEIVEEMIYELENSELDEDSNVVIKVYDNNGETVKLSMQYAGITMEIEYVYGDTESSIKITSVEDKTGEGLSLKVTNKKSDLTQSFVFEISVIEDSLVSETSTVTTKIIKSGSDYTFDMGVEYKTSDASLTLDFSSDIQFVDVDIEDLTSENCILLDNLSDEEKTELLNSIYERVQYVLNEKLTQLSFIDTNTTEILVAQSGSTDDNETNKETAKEDLILAIQAEMTEAYNNGEDYTIQDLDGLEVEGHTVEIELSENLAIVIVDGYTFNIDSEFNLTEE